LWSKPSMKTVDHRFNMVQPVFRDFLDILLKSLCNYASILRFVNNFWVVSLARSVETETIKGLQFEDNVRSKDSWDILKSLVKYVGQAWSQIERGAWPWPRDLTLMPLQSFNFPALKFVWRVQRTFLASVVETVGQLRPTESWWLSNDIDCWLWSGCWCCNIKNRAFYRPFNF